MLILRTNTGNFIARVLSLFVVIALEYLLIKNGIIDKANGGMPVALCYILIAMLAYVFSGIISMLLGIIRVEVRISSGEIMLNRLFSKTIISKSNIDGYYTTIYYNGPGKRWEGILIKTSNRSFRLMQQNLKSIPELKQYFEKENLKYLGEKQTRFSK